MNVRQLCTACVAALALTTAACEPKDSACGEPLYAGKATDEAWHALEDARQRPADASRAVTLLSPSEGELYSAEAAPPRWEWTAPLHASLEPRASPRPGRALASWLGELLLPTAHAHLPPYTGDLYLVEVSAPGEACPVAQVLTSELSWQLDPDTWEALGQHSGQALSVQVTSAYLLDNRVTEGPYQPATPRFFRRGMP